MAHKGHVGCRQQEGASRSKLSFAEAGSTLTLSAQARGPGFKGSQGWQRSRVPCGAWAQEEAIPSLMSQTMWERPQEVTESSINLSFTKGNKWMRAWLSFQEEGTGQRLQARGQRPEADARQQGARLPPLPARTLGRLGPRAATEACLSDRKAGASG